jgi:hypothetical protein
VAIPEQERDNPIRSTYEKVLQVLNEAELGDTSLLTVLDMLEDHFDETRKAITDSRKEDNCWDEGSQ